MQSILIKNCAPGQQQYFALSKRAMGMAKAVEDLCRLAAQDVNQPKSRAPSRSPEHSPRTVTDAHDSNTEAHGSKTDAHPQDCYVMPASFPYPPRDFKMLSPRVPVLMEAQKKQRVSDWTPRMSVQSTPPITTPRSTTTHYYNFKPIWR